MCLDNWFCDTRRIRYDNKPQLKILRIPLNPAMARQAADLSIFCLLMATSRMGTTFSKALWFTKFGNTKLLIHEHLYVILRELTAFASGLTSFTNHLDIMERFGSWLCPAISTGLYVMSTPKLTKYTSHVLCQLLSNCICLCIISVLIPDTPDLTLWDEVPLFLSKSLWIMNHNALLCLFGTVLNTS